MNENAETDGTDRGSDGDDESDGQGEDQGALVPRRSHRGPQTPEGRLFHVSYACVIISG
jgi:hypothetical protein